MNRKLFSSGLASTDAQPLASRRGDEAVQAGGRQSAAPRYWQAMACLSGLLAGFMLLGLGNVAAQTTTFNYTGGAQTYTVPLGCTAISVDCYGAAGFGLQGLGGRVQADHPVTPGEVLNIYVGGQGSETTGGFNGGGNPGSNTGYAGGGGGSDVRRGGSGLGNRIIVAGGGGGSGSNCGTWTAEGGHGGGLTGQSGCAWFCSDCQYTGAGGSQVAGGIAGPTGHGSCGGNQNGSLGQGGSNTLNGFGTGGGGGYYGGGSGCFEGAGGGSSYTGPSATNVIHTQGVRSGNGVITITPLLVVAPCTTPSGVTASPATLCSGQSSNLNAVSAGNNISWYLVSTGGSPFATVGSGVNVLVSPTSTTTYWAEAVGIGGTPGSQSFSYNGGIQSFTVPSGVTSITMDLSGAQGGLSGGLGANIVGTVSVTPGEVLSVLVGGQGGSYSNGNGGGGGGTFIWRNTGNVLLMAAGGGGGTSNNSNSSVGGPGSGTNTPTAAINGSGNGAGGSGGNGGSGGSAPDGGATYPAGGGGGCGWSSNGGNGSWTYGATGGARPLAGGAGGTGFNPCGGVNIVGGFGGGGGGGGCSGASGGGGGYNGGGGGNTWSGSTWGSGGGGGSYNSGSSQTNTTGARSGNGTATLSWTGSSCTASTRVPVTITVGTTPSAPSPVTANPTSVCLGGSSSLTATSTGNTINWYTVATGGSSIGSSASGAGFNVTPGSTTTYYAEAVTVGSGSGNQTFNFTGGVQTFTVPSGVTSLSVDCYGAAGFGALGYGGRVQANLPVTPGEVLNIYVGGMGSESAGGFNGGGNPGSNTGYAGGGGASDIRQGGTALGNRVIVAGGGGGSGSNCGTWTAEGGHGGGLTGQSGCAWFCSDCQYTGAGGSQVAGGIAGPTGHGSCGGNTNGSLGQGGSNTVNGFGTGGGGGYYGGGSGCFEGAGGGSSYTTPGATSVVHTQGVRTVDGLITLTWSGSSTTCTSATRTPVTVTVTGSPAAPSPVTASPATICVGNSSNLNGTSTGNNINWYTVATGGTAIGTSASGVNFPVTPGTTTTYYAETAVPGGSTSGSQTFNYTGGLQTFVVPSGVTSLTVDAYGAQGGDAIGNAVGWVSGPVNMPGGLGGRIQTTLAVTPGQTVNIYVGGKGTLTTGGFNGGGTPASCPGGTEVIWAGGGGATDLRIGGTALADRVVVAGGGGGSAGSGNTYQGTGGVGGGLTGGNGTFTGGGCMFGSGGSQVAGGTGGNNTCWCGTGATSPGGALGNGGNSVCAPSGLSTCSCSGTGCVSGAGGGGGYYGGGSSLASSGAGGGSSYAGTGTSGVTHTQGVRNGNGTVTISWTGVGTTCLSATRTPVTVTVNTSQPAPSPVTASPSSICAGGSSNLNATGVNTINWYTVATGGTAIGSSASGANFPVTPGSTTTYYAEVAASGGGGSGSQTFNYTGSLQTFTVPTGVTSIDVDGRGAQGGSVTVSCAATGGLGARMQGTFAVTPGEVLSIMVGQQGPTNGSDAGGGGGSFVVRTGNVCLLAAGGGGGATNNIGSCGANRNGINATITTNGTASGDGLIAGGTGGNGGGASTGSGGGGGGFLTNGVGGTGTPASAGKAYVNGGAGGTGNNADGGGYGGGGAGWFTGGNGGGGGGYSGGATSGAQPYTGGGGGGSFNGGSSQTNTAGFQSGNGQVIIAWNGGGGCAASTRVPVTVTVTGAPVTSNAGPDQTVCGTTATLAGNSPGSGTGAWSIISGAGGSVTTPSSPTSSFTGTAGTTYTLRWTITNPPCSPSTDDVVITLVGNPTTANAGPDQTVCGTSVTLAANAPTTGTGSWSIVSGAGGTVTTPSSPTSTFTGTANTVYTLRWTTSNPPCSNSTDDVVITLRSNPTTANAGPDQTVCATSVTLAANSPTIGTGSWSIVSGAGGTVTTPSSPTSTFTGTANTVYTLRWTTSNPPCTNSTDDVVITMAGNPTTANAGPDQNLCGTSATLVANTPTVGTGTWSIVSGAGGSIAVPTSATTTFTGVQGTVYTLRWTIANPPCASSTDDVVITLTANPTTANAGPDQTVCATSVTLAANTPTTGTGTWTIVSGAGGTVTTPSSPTSAFSGTANTVYTLRWTTSNPPCSNSTDDVVITLRSNPTAANAGPDQTVCATTVTLAANTPTIGTGSWSIVSGAGGSVATPTSATSTFTGTAGTVYTLRWTTSNPPCVSSTDDVVISLTGNPSVANAGPDQTVCATSVTLAGNTPTSGTGSWSIVSGAGGTITTPSSPTSAFSGTAGTTYTLRWTIVNAPCANSTDDVVISLNGNPTTANAGPDQTVCASSVTLAANTPTTGTGSWSIVIGAGGTVTTPSSPTSAFSGVAGTTYTLRWTIVNAPCANSTDDVVITLRANPTAAMAGVDQTICGTSANLLANTPTVGTGTWSILSGAGGTIAVPSSPTTTLTGVQGTAYTVRWTIANAPCAPSVDDIVITFVANPSSSNAGPDQTICATATTLAATPPAVGTGSWAIITGTGGTAANPTSPTSAFNGSAGQVYTIRWTISNSPCPASADDVVVTMTNPTTVSNAGPDQTVCATSVSLVANTPTSGTGSWSIVSGAGGSIAVPSSATTSFSGVAGTAYTLRWTITNPPCAPSTDDVVITLVGNPSTSNAGPDQTICATATTLAATAPAVGTGSWAIITGTGGTAANPTSPTSAFTGLGGQVYTIRWTISNSPCPASADDVVVTMTGGTTTANAGPDQTVCGSSVTMIANTPTFGTGSWSIVSGAGGSLTTPTSPTTAFSGTTGTTYTLRWTIVNPPCSPSTDDVVVTLMGNPTVSNAGPDQTVCAGGVTLAANTPIVGTGSWNIVTGAGGTVATPTSPTSAFTGVPGTSYTLRWTISNAPCSPSTDDVVINLTGTPTTPNAGPDQNVCGLTANLFANTPTVGTGLWSIVSGTGGSIATPTSATSAFTGTAGTTYTLRWTISNAPCAPLSDDVQITLTAVPTVANAGPDQTVCGGSTTLAGNTATVGTGAWTIIFGTGGTVTTPSSATSAFTGNPGSVYILRWTISGPPCSPTSDDVVITLTANPTTANAGPDQTVCGNTANLFGNSPTSGTGLWSIVSGAGGVIATPTSATTAFTGNPGTTYTLRWTITNAPCAPVSDDVVITLTASPTVANAGPDQTVCGGSVTLAGNTPTVGTGSWSIVSGAGGTVTTPSSPTSAFTGAAGTVYTLRWSISNAPCAPSTDDVVITLQATPTAPNAGPDQSVCGNTANLFGNSPTIGTGLWSIVSGAGGSIATPTSATTAFTGVPGTVYTLRWTITNAPCAPLSDDVVITLTANPTVANAGPDQTVCATSVTLAANTATVGTGSWSIVSGAGGTVATPSSPTSAFTGTANTVYTLRWTINNAPCTPSTDDVVITLTGNPTTPNAGPDQTVCSTTATLVGNTPTVGTGLWTIVSGAGGSIATPASPTSVFTGTAGTVYTLRWTISNAPCASLSDDVVVTLTGAPTVANAGPDQTLCATTVTLAANAPGTGTGSWSIVSGAGGTVTTPSSPTSTFTGVSGTVYTLRWTITNAPCAPSTDDVVINLTGNPTAPNAGPDQSVCATTANLIANTPTVGTGAWSIVSGAGGTVTTPLSATSTFTGVAGTVYTLRWTITNAPCAALSDDVVITLTGNPSTSNAGPDQTVCATSVTLAGNTPTVGTGTWTIVSGAGGTIATPSSPTSNFTGTAGVVYTLRWTIDNAPCAPSTDDVQIILTAPPTLATAGPDQNICGSSAILAGNTPSVGTGTWTIISGGSGSFGSASNPNSTFTGLTGNTYVLRWTITNPPCAATFDEVQISFTGASVPANAGPDQVICDTVTFLQGNTPTSGSGFWTIINGIGGTIVNPTSPTSQFNTTSGNVFILRWTIVNSPCPTTFDAVVITTDIVAPTISCPGPMAVNTNSNQCSAVVGFTSPVGLDNCPGATTTLVSGIPSGGTFPVGTTVNTYMVTDISGATATCTFSISVSDNQVPVALCQNVTVQLDNTGNGATTVGAVDNGSSDACGLASLSLSQTNFVCADVGINNETLTVVDNNGNSSSCATAITVQDMVAPVANCQAVTVQMSGTGTVTVSGSSVNNGSTDACGVQGFSLVPSSYTCSNIGSNNAVLTVTDVNGNTSTCTTTVTVQDNVAPTAVCQAITVQLNGTGNATVTGSMLDNGSSDACGIVSLTASVGAYTCANVGTNTNVLTVTDGNGNTSTCSTTVNVQDAAAPTAVCQAVTVQLDNFGNGSTTTTAVNNGSTDNCGILSMTLSQSAFNCADLGVNAESMTVTDINGNSSSCAVNITVEDNTVPTAICQNVTLQLGATGTGTVAASSVDNGSGDACSGTTLTLTLVPSTFSCSDVGNVATVLTVTDGQGNSSTCAATIAVVDALAPVAVCQDVTVNLDVTGNGSTTASAVASGSTDNCGIQSMSVSPTNFTCANIGANAVTVTITDVNGNTSSCIRNAQVQDVNAPVANCQAITVQLDQNGSGIALSSDVDNGSTDNCGISTRVVVPSIFNCSNVGVNTVVFTVTDVNGNTATCTTTVLVQDLIAPNAVCQNVTVTLDGSGNGSVTAIAVNNGSTDGCGIATVLLNGGSSISYNCTNIGSNSGSLQVTDVNGNTSNCNALITVVDNIAPTLTCPGNQTLVADSSLCGANATWTLPSVTDNCGTPTATGSHAPGSLFSVGTTTVTYSANDNSGNNGTCTFDIIVNAEPLVISISSPLIGCGFNLACAADQNAVVTGAVSGGCLPYTFLWSNGAVTQSLAGVGAGNYTVTVTDFRGTTATDNIQVTAPAPLTATTTGTALLCVGSTTGTVTVAASGGQTCQPYSYLWSTGATTTTISGLAAGAYIVTVTDNMGCTVIDTFTIAQGTVAFVNLGADVTTCPGVPHSFSTTGQFSTYQWSNGSTSFSILVAAPGTYSLTATTQDGCVDADTVVLANYVVDNDIITASGATTICQGSTVTLTGDAGLNGYTWNTGATTQAITVGTAGTYILNANDTHNCAVHDTVVVTLLPWNEPLPVVTPNPVAICPGGSATLDVGNFYTGYAWSNGATTQTITVTTAGNFTVTVTNSSGCTEVSAPAVVTLGTNPTPTLVFNLGILSTTQPYGSYQWVLNGNPIPGATSSTYTPGIPGIYTVIVTNQDGCSGESNAITYDPTAIGELVEDLEGLVLYPNPGRDVVNLRALSPIDWPLQVEIWDMFGHKVRSYDMAHLMDLASFDLSDLAAAPYTMKITTYRHNKTQQATIRFVLQ